MAMSNDGSFPQLLHDLKWKWHYPYHHFCPFMGSSSLSWSRQPTPLAGPEFVECAQEITNLSIGFCKLSSSYVLGFFISVQ
jgi:hypothetical protein